MRFDYFEFGDAIEQPKRLSFPDIQATLGAGWELRSMSADDRRSIWVLVPQDGVDDRRDFTIWDHAAKRELRKIQLSNHAGAWLFSRNGQFVAFGQKGKSASIEVYNLEMDEPPLRLVGHIASVRGQAFSSAGEWLASGSSDQTIRVWNLKTGQAVRTLRGHEGAVTGVNFLDHNKRLLSAGEDGTLRVWDWEDRPPPERLEGLQQRMGQWGAVVMSRDGRWLAGVTTNEACVWDSDTLKPVVRVPDCKAVLEFGPDDRCLYVLQTGRVTKWDISGPQPREMEHLTLDALNNAKTWVAVAPDGRHIAVGRAPNPDRS